MAALALLILVTPVAQHQLAVGLLVAAVAATVAWRNWMGGITITEHDVVVRNLARTSRVPLAAVGDVSFAPGGGLAGGWGYVRVRTRAGREVRATSLRRSPIDGAALALAIKSEVAARTQDV